MIRCESCGYENNNANIVCARCQSRLQRHEISVQEEYIREKEQAAKRQRELVQEASKKAIRTTLIVMGIITIIAIIVIWSQYGPRVDNRLTGSWTLNRWPNATWVFDSSGKVSMNSGEPNIKYRAENGRLRLWPDSQFETVYTYHFATGTDNSGNQCEVLILNGGELVFYKGK